MMFAACSSEDSTLQNMEKVPIRFTAKIQSLIPSIGTRVAEGTTGILNNEFPEGAEISVGFGDPYISDAVLKNTSGTWSYTGTPLNYAVNRSTVFAYYPKLSSTVTSIIRGSYSTPDDQSLIDNYKKADVLAATADVSTPSSNPIELSFMHICAKVVVKLSASTTPSDYEIKMKGINKLTMYNGASLSSISNGPGEVTLGKYSSAGQTAIIIPQQVAENTVLFEVSKGEIKYSFTTSSSITFKAGYKYTFNLTFEDTEISFGNIIMCAWETDSENSKIGGDLVKN